MLKILSIVAGLVVLALVVPLLMPPRDAAAPPTHGLPWQIETPAAGQSRVFGLTLAEGKAASTLAEARAKFPDAPKLALVAPAGGALSLEAWFDTVSLGGLTGKLLLTLDVPADRLEAMRASAAKSDYLDSGIKHYLLNDADRQAAQTTPLKGITFIPSANLDAVTAVERFGIPYERFRQGETLEHLLYPAKGLDVVIDAKGKDVLQYVAPTRFALLREPLREATGTK